MDYSKHLQKAEEALRRRNYDFAIEVYQQLIDIEPDLGEARGGLRRALRLRFEKKGGGKLFRALAGAGPLAAAKGLVKAGKHRAAAKSLESYLVRNPMDEDANLLLGECLENAGFTKSARAVYEFLAEIAPKNPDGLKRAGAMMYAHGDHVEALQYYERALEADPRDQEALKARKNLAAETALSAGRYDQVQHSREQIVDKDEAQRLERKSRMHMGTEELEAELERLQGVYAEQSSDPDVMLEIADVLEKLKDFEGAQDMVERALQYRKDSFELVCRAGDLRSKVLKKKIAQAGKQGDEAAADRYEAELTEFEIEDARRRVEVHPGDASLRLRLGKRLMRSGQHDAALGEFQKAQGDQRSKRDALFFMAQCFQHKGFMDLARQEYENALEGAQGVDERAKEIMYNLGSIAESQGDGEAARSHYARVYQADIGYRDVASKMEQFK